MHIAINEHTQDYYEQCVKELRAFVRGIGKTDVVLGLSGGIDSSVTACMCVEAFGAQHVHGVMMPGPYSSEHSVADAQALAENLGIETHLVPIKDMYDAAFETLSPCIPQLGGLAAENMQARCRMVVLMAFSNAQDWILINTDNKSEAMTGYSTLYGDTAGAYAPMGGLYKVDVYRVAEWINQRAQEMTGSVLIPDHVIVKAPSAELAPDQTDEAVFGSYEDLDRILMQLVERGVSADELIAQGEDAATVHNIVRLMKASAFKRKLLAPYPSIAY